MVTVVTEDLPAMESFYGELLGTEPTASSESIAIFETNGVQLLIQETYVPDDGDLPPEDHLSFATEGVDGAFATRSENGFTVFREPAAYDWGRSAYFRDPDG